MSVVIRASRRALRNGEIIRICMGKKQFLLQFKQAKQFSIKISLPELPCLLSFLLVNAVFGAIERDFSEL